MKPHKRITRGMKATAAPGILSLGGRELFVRPPTAADLITLRKWARKVWADQIKAGGSRGPAPISPELFKDLTDAERLAVLQAMGEKLAAGREITESEALDIVTTPAGVALMVYLSARPFHADLTIEWVKAQITDENVLFVHEDWEEQVAAEDQDTGAPDLKPAGSDTSGPSSSV